MVVMNECLHLSDTIYPVRGPESFLTGTFVLPSMDVAGGPSCAPRGLPSASCEFTKIRSDAHIVTNTKMAIVAANA
jgi:hypothetical protein